MTFRRLFAAALSLSLASPAAAQMSMPNIDISIMYPVVMNPCPGGKCTGVSDRAARRAPPPARNRAEPTRAAPTTSASLVFTPSAALRQKNLAGFLARSRNDPAIRDTVAGADRIFPQVEAMLAAKGLRANDVGDLYAVWWISAYDALHGHTGTRSAATYRAVKAQAARAILASPQFARATPALKQEMADALIVQTIAIDVTVDHAKADPARLRAVGQAVAQGARRMGVDLSVLRLTEAGFEGAG